MIGLLLMSVKEWDEAVMPANRLCTKRFVTVKFVCHLAVSVACFMREGYLCRKLLNVTLDTKLFGINKVWKRSDDAYLRACTTLLS